MTLDDSTDHLTAMLRSFMAGVRRHVNDDGLDDPVDRVLAAATIAIAAVMIAWPNGRKLPKIANLAIGLGRHIWARRSWWIEPVS